MTVLYIFNHIFTLSLWEKKKHLSGVAAASALIYKYLNFSERLVALSFLTYPIMQLNRVFNKIFPTIIFHSLTK